MLNSLIQRGALSPRNWSANPPRAVFPPVPLAIIPSSPSLAAKTTSPIVSIHPRSLSGLPSLTPSRTSRPKETAVAATAPSFCLVVILGHSSSRVSRYFSKARLIPVAPAATSAIFLKMRLGVYGYPLLCSGLQLVPDPFMD